MAFSLRMTGLKWKDGVTTAITFSGDVPGAVIDSDDPRFRDLSEDPGYRDYYAVLGKEEALQMVEAGKWLVESWMKFNASSTARTSYESMLEAIQKSEVVIAHIYEWESGMGD